MNSTTPRSSAFTPTTLDPKSTDSTPPRSQARESHLRGSRREFLGTGAAASLAAGVFVHAGVSAAEPARELRLGVVGCGGRGSGAINDSLTINDGVKLVALADLYTDKCARLRSTLAQAHGEKVAVDDQAMHGGLDGYRRILDDPQIDVVLLTMPPGFRPTLLREAVEAGKHVFAEKPVCVDPAGYRSCLATHELAVARGTAIVTGTQYRRQVNYLGAIEQIRSGAIGEIIAGTGTYCSNGIWYRPRQEGMSDAEYQVNNWMHFIWLSGDQIGEQAIHTLDTINWAMGENPISAFGSGGRFTRPADSEMWDSMAVDYEYPGDRFVSFTCWQIPGAATDLHVSLRGTKGTCHIGAINAGCRIVDRSGREIWQMKGSIADAYKQEHKDLIDSIRAGNPIVELRQTADSSLVAIMGRMAAYSGKKVTWTFASEESQLDLFPKDLTWDASLPQPQWAIPGKTPLV